MTECRIWKQDLTLKCRLLGLNDKKIVEAVKTGTLAEDVLDQAVERILNIVYRFEENRDATAVFDREADHALREK